MSSSRRRDTIFLRGIQGTVSIAADAWGRDNKPQPYVVSVEIQPKASIEDAGRHDDIDQTLNYGQLYKQLHRMLQEGQQTDIADMGVQLHQEIQEVAQSYELKIHLPKAYLRAADGLYLSLSYSQTQDPLGSVQDVYDLTYRLAGIRVACIIGINPHERLHKQDVITSLSLESASFDFEDLDFLEAISSRSGEIVDRVAAFIEGSSFETLEALSNAIARIVTMDYNFQSVGVEVEKPNAIATISAAGVRLHRRKSFFANQDFWEVKHP